MIPRRETGDCHAPAVAPAGANSSMRGAIRLTLVAPLAPVKFLLSCFNFHPLPLNTKSDFRPHNTPPWTQFPKSSSKKLSTISQSGMLPPPLSFRGVGSAEAKNVTSNPSSSFPHTKWLSGRRTSHRTQMASFPTFVTFGSTALSGFPFSPPPSVASSSPSSRCTPYQCATLKSHCLRNSQAPYRSASLATGSRAWFSLANYTPRLPPSFRLFYPSQI